MAIKDSEFIRGKVPLTKKEVRAVTLAKLNLQEDDHFLDIGAGTGGISIEAAVANPNLQVTAIDNNGEAVELISKNALKFQVKNLSVKLGTAPEALTEIQQPTKVFIGGSKGNLPEIFDWVNQNTQSGTTVVANAVTLETLETLRKCIKEKGFHKAEIVQISVARVEEIGKSSMLKAENPIFIITTSKV